MYEAHAHILRSQALMEPSCTKPMRIYFVHKPSWRPRVRNPCAYISFTRPHGAPVCETRAHIFRSQAIMEPSCTKPMRIYFFHKPSWSPRVRHPCAYISVTSHHGALVSETHAHIFCSQALMEPSCTKLISPHGVLVYEIHAHIFRSQAVM